MYRVLGPTPRTPILYWRLVEAHVVVLVVLGPDLARVVRPLRVAGHDCHLRPHHFPSLGVRPVVGVVHSVVGHGAAEEVHVKKTSPGPPVSQFEGQAN